MPDRNAIVESAIPKNRPAAYSPTRRTAVVLSGEGTSAAYLGGALKALDESGVRIDLLIGRGVGALVAVFAAIQSVGKLHEASGLFALFERERPWRLRSLYRAAWMCSIVSFLVFVSPALLGLLALLALPVLAAARVVAPTAVDSVYRMFLDRLGAMMSQVDPLYLRALALPVAAFFVWLLVVSIAPALLRRRSAPGGLSRFLGDGVFELSRLFDVTERLLWEAVRGASVAPRPAHPRDIGLRYRELLLGSFGQHGFRELIFYALDLDTGQEVPFVLLKDRWRSRMKSRAPMLADPVDLAGGDGSLLFDALMASVSPPVLTPGIPLQLPLEGRSGGEVHRFASSLLSGRSAMADAMVAGAEQILYVSGTPASGPGEAGTLEKLLSAADRQSVEFDLRWAREGPNRPLVFVVRPEKRRLGLLEFPGRKLQGGERLGLSALLAHGERDIQRLFIEPVVGEGTPCGQGESSGAGGASQPGTTLWGEGPSEM